MGGCFSPVTLLRWRGRHGHEHNYAAFSQQNYTVIHLSWRDRATTPPSVDRCSGHAGALCGPLFDLARGMALGRD